MYTSYITHNHNIISSMVPYYLLSEIWVFSVSGHRTMRLPQDFLTRADRGCLGCAEVPFPSWQMLFPLCCVRLRDQLLRSERKRDFRKPGKTWNNYEHRSHIYPCKAYISYSIHIYPILFIGHKYPYVSMQRVFLSWHLLRCWVAEPLRAKTESLSSRDFNTLMIYHGVSIII